MHFKKSFNNSCVKKRRHDICYLSSYIKPLKSDTIAFNNNRIMVSHKSSLFEENKLQNVKLHLVGHSHTSKSFFELHSDKLIAPRIMAPPLARNSVSREINIPRAIELIIHMNNKYDFKFVEKKDLLILNNKAINTGETIINYGKDNICLASLEKIDTDNSAYKDDTLNSRNQTFKDSEEKEIGELSEEQKQEIKNFYKTKASRSLERKIRKMKYKK